MGGSEAEGAETSYRTMFGLCGAGLTLIRRTEAEFATHAGASAYT